MSDSEIRAITIEIRCKGGFAYIRGNEGVRLLAVPHPPDGEKPHLCQLYVRETAILAGAGSFKDPRRKDDLKGFLVFKEALTDLRLDDQAFAQPKDGATSPIPRDGAPNGSPDADDSWTSAGFIPSFRRLYPPQLEPTFRALDERAGFRMKLPTHTQWHGLRPWQENERRYMWEFRDEGGEGSPVLQPQALTDVVGIRLTTSMKPTMYVSTKKHKDVEVVLDFSHLKDLTTSKGFPIALVASPKKMRRSASLGEGEVLEHFKHLYHLVDPGVHEVIAPVLGPMRRRSVREGQADDIFCPGGEGEGGE